MKALEIPFLKTIDISQATAPLAEYVRRTSKEPVIISSKGKPIAALVPVDEVDLETLSVGTSPDFLTLIAHSRARHEAEGGLSTAEVRHMLGLKAPKRKPIVKRIRAASRST